MTTSDLPHAAAGLRRLFYPHEAGVGLLITHASFLDRSDFTGAGTRVARSRSGLHIPPASMSPAGRRNAVDTAILHSQFGRCRPSEGQGAPIPAGLPAAP